MSKQRVISEASSVAAASDPIQEMHTERDSEADRRIGQVFRTMLIFTSLMVVCPIMTYFYSRTHIFEGVYLPLLILVSRNPDIRRDLS